MLAKVITCPIATVKRLSEFFCKKVHNPRNRSSRTIHDIRAVQMTAFSAVFGTKCTVSHYTRHCNYTPYVEPGQRLAHNNVGRHYQSPRHKTQRITTPNRMQQPERMKKDMAIGIS